MNWHEIMDERALEMDAVIARVLRDDPAKLKWVVAWIERFLADPVRERRARRNLSAPHLASGKRFNRKCR